MTDYSNPVNASINCSFYCIRCKNSFMQRIVNAEGLSAPKILTFIRKDGSEFTGRQLMCGHTINYQDAPLSTNEPSKIQVAEGNLVDPEELRKINIEETLKFAKMNDEQKESHIQFHVEQYKLHLLAAKKEKYIIQLLEDLVEKLIRDLSASSEEEQQIKRNKEIKFGYLFRQPEKKLRIEAKEKVKKEAKEKKTGKAEKSVEEMMQELRDLMRNKGLNLSDIQ